MRALPLVLAAVLVAGCVDPAADAARSIAGLTLGVSGDPQRLWERYVLSDIEGNAVPALCRDSAGVRFLVVADTLYFTLATGLLREVAVVSREPVDAPATVTRAVSSPSTTFTHLGGDGVAFESIVFGPSRAVLSGATRIQPFSPFLRSAGGGANWRMF